MNIFALSFHPAVALEVHETYKRYEELQQGLGERFLFQLNTTFSVILENPETYGFKGHKLYREALIDQFPYLIVYRYYPRKKQIVVAAIHHYSMNPARKYR